MAPTETNHGSGDVSGRPSPLAQHQPATQQTEPYPDSISLPQTPETAQRAFVLNDSDHPGIDVGNTAPVNLANAALGQQGPHIPFMHSPPRPEARLTPPPQPATGLESNPPWNIRTTAWPHGQDENGPLIGLGLLCPWAALAAGGGADNDDFRSAPAPAPAPKERFADRPAEEAVGDGSAATCGGQLSSSSATE